MAINNRQSGFNTGRAAASKSGIYTPSQLNAAFDTPSPAAAEPQSSSDTNQAAVSDSNGIHTPSQLNAAFDTPVLNAWRAQQIKKSASNGFTGGFGAGRSTSPQAAVPDSGGIYTPSQLNATLDTPVLNAWRAQQIKKSASSGFTGGFGAGRTTSQGGFGGGFGGGRTVSEQSASEQSTPWLDTPQYGDDGTVLAVQGQDTPLYDFGDDGTVLSQDKLAQYGNRGYDESTWEDNPVRKAMRQLVLGRYTDETTPLGTTLQILAGLAGVDAPADVRDLYYDLTHWEDTTEHKWQLALDLVAVLPIIGAVKNAKQAGELAQEVLKHGDEISDVLKALPSGADKAAEIIGDLAKHSDEAAELAQGALKNGDDIDAIISEVFDEGDEAGKTIRNIADDEGDWLKDVTEDAGDYSSLAEKARNADVSTSAHQAVFYSGEGNRVRAEAFAQLNGKTTLEMTPGGKYFDSLDLFGKNSPLTDDQAHEIWSILSERYAKGASGNIYGFVEGARPGSIFNTVEYPALQKNPYITNIFTGLFK